MNSLVDKPTDANFFKPSRERLINNFVSDSESCIIGEERLVSKAWNGINTVGFIAVNLNAVEAVTTSAASMKNVTIIEPFENVQSCLKPKL